MARGLLTSAALFPFLAVAVTPEKGSNNEVAIFNVPAYRVKMETRAFRGCTGDRQGILSGFAFPVISRLRNRCDPADATPDAGFDNKAPAFPMDGGGVFHT